MLSSCPIILSHPILFRSPHPTPLPLIPISPGARARRPQPELLLPWSRPGGGGGHLEHFLIQDACGNRNPIGEIRGRFIMEFVNFRKALYSQILQTTQGEVILSKTLEIF